jgi:hypothetical protein
MKQIEQNLSINDFYLVRNGEIIGKFKDIHAYEIYVYFRFKEFCLVKKRKRISTSEKKYLDS